MSFYKRESIFASTQSGFLARKTPNNMMSTRRNHVTLFIYTSGDYYTHVNREAEVAAGNALPSVPKRITDKTKPEEDDEEEAN